MERNPKLAAYREMLMRRSYVADSHVAPLRDGLDMRIPVAQSVPNERLHKLLGLIGRFYVMEISLIYPLMYVSRFSRNTLRRDLQLLHEQKLLWMVPISRTSLYPGVKGGKDIKIYGLTPEGRMVLEELGGMDKETVSQLRTADSRTQTIPKPSSFGHDMQVSWWCGSMVEGLRLIPWCSGVYVQVEYTNMRGQRPDAILVARFNFLSPRQDLADIPWISMKERKGESEVEVRYALELDNSSESLDVLQAKFVKYRDYHKEGVYQKDFGGDLMLVLVVQDGNRARRLAKEFTHVWSEGWGVVSTSQALSRGDDLQFGALWATYKDMNTEESVLLLSRIQQQKNSQKRAYVPMITLNMFICAMDLALAGKAPETLTEVRDFMDDEGLPLF